MYCGDQMVTVAGEYARRPLSPHHTTYTRTTPATPPRNTHYTFTREPSHPHTVYLPSPTHAHLKSRISTAGNVQQVLFMVIKVCPSFADQHQPSRSPARHDTTAASDSTASVYNCCCCCCCLLPGRSMAPVTMWGRGGALHLTVTAHAQGQYSSARSTPTRRVGGAGLGRLRAHKVVRVCSGHIERSVAI